MVLIGCCLFQCAMIGILINCTGVLFAQIRAELGFSMSRVSLYNTLKSVSTSLSAGVITAIFFKANKARFLLLNQCAIVLSFLLIIWGAEGPLWYLSAIINGAAFCIANIAVPMLLGRWFPEHSGAVTGIAMAFSGIGGAVCNPVCAALIQNLGWQWTIVVLGIITMAMTIPGMYLMFHYRAPVVQAEHASAGQNSQEQDRAPLSTVILVCITLVGGFVSVAFALNISMYAQSIGYSLSVGASLTTMVMIGNVASKFIYGVLCDRFGTWKATMAVLAVVAASLLCFLFVQQQIVMLFVASLLYGCVYALTVVAISRCCNSAYPPEAQKRYLGLHTSINNAVMAGASLLVGVLYDQAQSFSPVLYLTLVMVICSFAAASYLAFQTKNK